MQFSKKQKIIFGTFFLVILAILLWRVKFWQQNKTSNTGVLSGGQAQQLKQLQSLNGLMLDNLALAGSRPLAVVIENHPDARPQSGLAKADLVYETLAEGGITRFLAVYQSQKADNIGPIRSARTYFSEIADELGAVFVHVGGNSDALADLKMGDYPHLLNMDQFFHGDYFHRITQRLAPHNVYSSTTKLQAFILASKSADKAEFGPWLYTDNFSGTQPAEKITVSFSYPEYEASYVYDAARQAYERFLAGKPHVDAEGQIPIYAKNIIVQSVRTWPVQTDTPLSIGMDLDGGGQAYVFSSGRMLAGTWKKAAGDRTRYYDEQGREIQLSRGATWIELVPEEKMGELKWSAAAK